MRLAEIPVRPDLLWRAGVVGAVVVGALLAAPEPALRVGALVSVGLAAERSARRRGRGVVDAGVLAGGGLLAGLVLVGLVVGGPWGVSTRAWTAGFGLAALVALVGAARGPAGPGRPGRPGRLGRPGGPGAGSANTPPGGWREVLRAAPWVAVSLVVVVVAVGTASRSAERAVPPDAPSTGLSMAFGVVSATTVDVVVTPAPAEPDPGPLAVRVTIGTTEISYPVFTPAGGLPHTSRVSVPLSGRFDIDLVDPEDGTVVRTLTIAR